MIGLLSRFYDIRNISVMKAVIPLDELRSVAFAIEQFILYLIPSKPT